MFRSITPGTPLRLRVPPKAHSLMLPAVEGRKHLFVHRQGELQFYNFTVSKILLISQIPLPQRGLVSCAKSWSKLSGAALRGCQSPRP